MEMTLHSRPSTTKRNESWIGSDQRAQLNGHEEILDATMRGIPSPARRRLEGHESQRMR
jgi:hypothetical protein